MVEAETQTGQEGTQTNPIDVEQEETQAEQEGTQTNPTDLADNEFSLLIRSTTLVLLETELMLLNEQVKKYCKWTSACMLALDDATLTKMANVAKFSEAFLRGWGKWKTGNEEEAFQLFCNVMAI